MILDARRDEDPRLTVICTDRIGPGRARNVGAEHANGEYVWFVDGDDLILPGSLAAIADRFKEAQPDLLFLDHEAFYPDGTRGPEPDILGGQGHPDLALHWPRSPGWWTSTWRPGTKSYAGTSS